LEAPVGFEPTIRVLQLFNVYLEKYLGLSPGFFYLRRVEIY